LKAAFALPLDRAERRLFRAVAGHRKPPSRPVRELAAIVGRGGGKDSIAAALAAYVASTGDFTRLRPGERASVLCIACDRTQAGIAFGYVRGLFENVPLLAGMVARITHDTIELINGAEIIVATNSFRSVRGKTVILAIYDEVAFWASEDYANPDFEVDAAISPGLARYPGALKIMISSAHKTSGLLYQRWKDYFARDDDDTLVVLGDTLTFN
jgi:phage terminase large subunit-like protein